jgi:hypothetical protein
MTPGEAMIVRVLFMILGLLLLLAGHNGWLA